MMVNCWMITLVVTDWIRIIIIEGGASAPDDTWPVMMMGAQRPSLYIIIGVRSTIYHDDVST